MCMCMCMGMGMGMGMCMCMHTQGGLEAAELRYTKGGDVVFEGEGQAHDGGDHAVKCEVLSVKC